jgi:hypothetical protein
MPLLHCDWLINRDSKWPRSCGWCINTHIAVSENEFIQTCSAGCQVPCNPAYRSCSSVQWVTAIQSKIFILMMLFAVVCCLNYFHFINCQISRSQISTLLKSTIFWDITLCSPLRVNRCFGRTYCLHLQARKINWARNQIDSQRSTLRYIPEDGTLHNHRCENLKFYTLFQNT